MVDIAKDGIQGSAIRCVLEDPARICSSVRDANSVSTFVEGVRALLIDKDNAPAWQPASLSGVTGAMVEAIVTPEDAPVLAIPEASVSTKGKA